jgi:hypothetical protein
LRREEACFRLLLRNAEGTAEVALILSKDKFQGRFLVQNCVNEFHLGRRAAAADAADACVGAVVERRILWAVQEKLSVRTKKRQNKYMA